MFEGLGPPWEASWWHWEVSGGLLEVLGSILVPFRSPLDSIWCPWGAILEVLGLSLGIFSVFVGQMENA